MLKAPEIPLSYIVQYIVQYHKCRKGETQKTFNIERIQCTKCDKQLSSKGYLKTHMMIHSEHREKFPCNICEIECATEHYLKKHKQTHDEQEQFPCDICSDQFTLKANLKRHKLSKHKSANQ